MAIQQELLEQLLKSPRLPSIPAVALKIIDLVQQDEVNMDEIAETIRQDPALATKILKTVNSSFYGQPKSIGTINQALVVIGLNSVKTLALGFCLVGNLAQAGAEGFDHDPYWKRSLYAAAAAKQICNHMVIVQAEEVFTASLLQDVGILAFSQVLGRKYASLHQRSNGDHHALVELERRELQGDHAEAGATLIEGWGLPPVIAEPIRYHESPDDAPENVILLARAVAAGGYIADLLIHPDDPKTAEQCNDRLQTWFGMEAEQTQKLLSDTHQHAKEIQHLFSVPSEDLGKTDEILRQAKEVLEQVSLTTAKKAEELERTNEQLQQEVNTDALTGVNNRRRFDVDVAGCFADASEARPVSIMFLDIDAFKAFNDTYGHAVGDQVLQAFAEALVEAGGNVGTVYRYGGEEFAMLFPGVDRKAAAFIAETIRETVDRDVYVTGPEGQRLNVTVSIGVVTHDGQFFKRVDQFVKAADRGVYSAKGSGRNCVRVFVPRTRDKSDAA